MKDRVSGFLCFRVFCLFSRLKFLVGETQDGTVKFFIMKSERFRFDIVFHFRKLSSPPREHSLIRLVFAESGKSSYRWSCATWHAERDPRRGDAILKQLLQVIARLRQENAELKKKLAKKDRVRTPA